MCNYKNYKSDINCIMETDYNPVVYQSNFYFLQYALTIMLLPAVLYGHQTL